MNGFVFRQRQGPPSREVLLVWSIQQPAGAGFVQLKMDCGLERRQLLDSQGNLVGAIGRLVHKCDRRQWSAGWPGRLRGRWFRGEAGKLCVEGG